MWKHTQVILAFMALDAIDHRRFTSLLLVCPASSVSKESVAPPRSTIWDKTLEH